MKITETVAGTYMLEVPASMIWIKDPITRDQETIVFIHDTKESAELQAKYYADYNNSNTSTNADSIVHRDR